MLVVLDKALEHGTSVADFIDELKQIPCLHFKSIPEAVCNSEIPETLPAAETGKA